MVLAASAWSLFVLLPLGWWLSRKFVNLKSDLAIEEVPSPVFWLVAVALLALILEVMGIWYELPIVFFVSLWCILSLEAYWSVEEIAAADATSDALVSKVKTLFYFWVALGAVPVFLCLLPA